MEPQLRLNSVLEKQRKRYLLLLRIYELTDGSEREILMLEPPDGLDENEIMTIVDYLAGEGLVERLADEAPLLRISHLGVVEVEQSLLNPKEPTQHFAAPVIQHFHGNVVSVQTGNHNVAHVIENSNAEVVELLEQLRRHLSSDTPTVSQEANELLSGLESEVKSQNPSQSRLRAYLNAMGSFVRDTGKDLLVEISAKLIRDEIGM